MVHHVEMRWMKSVEPCAVGKYFRIAARVDGSKMARATGTLCLQFPGCRTVVESLSFARRLAEFTLSYSWTRCNKLHDYPPSCNLQFLLSSQIKGGKSNCLRARKLFLGFLMRWAVSWNWSIVFSAIHILKESLSHPYSASKQLKAATLLEWLSEATALTLMPTSWRFWMHFSISLFNNPPLHRTAGQHLVKCCHFLTELWRLLLDQ